MNFPQISAIVPVYKVEQYLNESIDSILAQTFTDFELILIDDGSPDNCGNICDEYLTMDNRITVIHKQNGGLSDARNVGLEIAAGEYISFIDSDDFVSPVFLKVLFKNMKESGADISTCCFLEFEGDATPKRLAPQENKPIILSGREACKKVYDLGNALSVTACDKLYSKRLFLEKRYPVGLIHEDDATTPRLLYSADKVAISKDKLYYYRTRADSITKKKFTKKRFDGLKAIDICCEFFKQFNDNEMIEVALIAKQIINSVMIIKAYRDNAETEILPEYKMTELQALRQLREILPDEKYTWYLAQNHPKWLLPHAYIRKIKKVLGIPCQ